MDNKLWKIGSKGFRHGMQPSPSSLGVRGGAGAEGLKILEKSLLGGGHEVRNFYFWGTILVGRGGHIILK